MISHHQLLQVTIMAVTRELTLFTTMIVTKTRIMRKVNPAATATLTLPFPNTPPLSGMPNW